MDLELIPIMWVIHPFDTKDCGFTLDCALNGEESYAWWWDEDDDKMFDLIEAGIESSSPTFSTKEETLQWCKDFIEKVKPYYSNKNL